MTSKLISVKFRGAGVGVRIWRLNFITETVWVMLLTCPCRAPHPPQYTLTSSLISRCSQRKYANPLEFAESSLSIWWTNGGRQQATSCGSAFVPIWLVMSLPRVITGHVGTNTMKFVPPRWSSTGVWTSTRSSEWLCKCGYHS